MPFRKLYTKVRGSHLIFSLAANINTYMPLIPLLNWVILFYKFLTFNSLFLR